MTQLDRITKALTASLAPITPGNPVDVEPVGDPDAFPALDVTINGWSTLEREADATRRALSATVSGYVERGDGQEASAERAALHAAVVHAILTDPTLADLIELVDDDDLRMTTAVLAERRRLGFAQDLTIQFVTSRTDPAQPA